MKMISAMLNISFFGTLACIGLVGILAYPESSHQLLLFGAIYSVIWYLASVVERKQWLRK